MEKREIDEDPKLKYERYMVIIGRIFPIFAGINLIMGVLLMASTLTVITLNTFSYNIDGVLVMLISDLLIIVSSLSILLEDHFDKKDNFIK